VLKVVGNVKLANIGLPDFERYQSLRLKNGISQWCINKELYLLRMMLNRANLWNGQLARLYKPLKTKTSDIGKALTREELEQLVKTALRNEDWQVTMYGSVLAANTGLRGEEVRQLKLGTLDLAKRELQVLRATAKNDSAARNIPLNKDAFAAAMCLYQRALRLGANGPQHYLLPACMSRHTKSFDPLHGGRGYDTTRNQQSWRSSWESLTKAAGLSGFNFHSLRHTFITHMVEEGVPLEHIQTMVGHLSPKMVRHYTHIATRVLHKDVAVLDQRPILAHLIQAPESLEIPTVESTRGAIQ
jgi:integrase